ncbi:MAG: Asp-tRNA(Asn)/Glu-tRNA(Gln) amidotransferase subunit GatB [Lutispora sp.]|nr:Asp-tRNA(Asn)/Glu-tRNA(Gln) amidotransferase subunit GatB [Lutispora sp.]
MNYETIIGLEIHAELSTKSKAFCSCKNEFGGEVNTNCCPSCLGYPGALPVMNKKVVEYAVKAGLALNCEISLYSKTDRKNYFYPDLPKAYQVSQYDIPLCKDGRVEIQVNDEIKPIGITRIHIEEDAGKLIHGTTGEDYSLVDFNRSGVPLIEIVSEPDMRSPEEARLYLEKLKGILEYLEISDCKMQEGSLRCDANISLRPVGQKEFGIKTEIKNMNSMKALQKALEYEVERHNKVLSEGGTIVQETRRWDEAKGITISMRAKEQAHDYRYFPEPDLVPIILEEKWIEEIRKTLPELPDEKKRRFMEEYGIPDYDASVLTLTKELSSFFEACAKNHKNPKAISNWVMGEVLRIMKEKELELKDLKINPESLRKLVDLVDGGVLSNTGAKQVFDEMFRSGKEPEILVDELGLRQISDEDVIVELVKKVLDENKKSVEDYKNGKSNALGFLVGQCMKASKGKGNPQLINKILKDLMRI